MSAETSPRWYGGRDWRGGKQVPCQWGNVRREATTIPEPIARLAHEEYARHHNQSFERLHERGGFGPAEVMMLLADTIERERRTRKARAGVDDE